MDVSEMPDQKLTAVFINQANVDASVFDDIKGVFDVYIRAIYGKNLCWLVTITTNRDDLDVSKLARKYGGNGHRKSAGFAIDDIFDFFKPTSPE